ncbi:hypothetical protein SNEBB_001979 [Seison nebaliae]|nr:hypothetical protein SNEBB_001979 [Seison nebaliae]
MPINYTVCPYVPSLDSKLLHKCPSNCPYLQIILLKRSIGSNTNQWESLVKGLPFFNSIARLSANEREMVIGNLNTNPVHQHEVNYCQILTHRFKIAILIQSYTSRITSLALWKLGYRDPGKTISLLVKFADGSETSVDFKVIDFPVTNYLIEFSLNSLPQSLQDQYSHHRQVHNKMLVHEDNQSLFDS